MKYFSFPEFEQSVTAALKGYDNSAPREAQRNIEYLVDTVLDPLREHLAQPIVITSGYRCRDLNHDVGGSPTSQHLLGLAADFRPLHATDEQMDTVRQWFRENAERLEFDQMIDYGSFFHVGVRPEGSTNRRQMKRYNAFGQGYRKD
ncbi:MAG: peptidase M15 [Bacteroidaceae bacterium]|nr:peptidase M15 [Bacteroidaceae bacterium]